MIITKRDDLILKTCLEQWFMTLVQISKMFFDKSRNVLQVPMKKVRELVNAGYLGTVRLRIGEKRLYVTTKKGVRHLRKKKLSSGLRAIEKVNDKTWEHDEIVTEVRIVFQKLLGFTEWIPERALKKNNVRKKVPDAIASNGKQKFVIEVELSLKNKRYYERVLLDMCIQYSREDGILYIMKDETDMKWLMNHTKGWDRIYFTTLEDITKVYYGVKFTNAKGVALYLPRLHKGGVLFFDPDEEMDDGLDEFREDDAESERFRKEEEARKENDGTYEEEEFEDEEDQTTEG